MGTNMQYVIYGSDAAALTANHVDALALQSRVDTALGYPHGITTHAISVEPNVSNTAWAVEIPQVAQWSWATLQYVAVTDFLTVSEINALKPFQYLVDKAWWGGE